MIRLQGNPPTLWPAADTIAEDREPLDQALQDMVQNDLWIDDFIERLNCAIRDIVKKP